MTPFCLCTLTNPHPADYDPLVLTAGAVLAIPAWEWDSTQATLLGAPITERHVFANATLPLADDYAVTCALTVASGIDVGLCVGFSQGGHGQRVAAERLAYDLPIEVRVCGDYAEGEYSWDMVVGDADATLRLLMDALALGAAPDVADLHALMAHHRHRTSRSSICIWDLRRMIATQWEDEGGLSHPPLFAPDAHEGEACVVVRCDNPPSPAGTVQRWRFDQYYRCLD